MPEIEVARELPMIALATFGIAWVIADSKISLPGRRLVANWRGEDSFLLALLECPPCLSFWIGLAVARFAYHLGWASIAIGFLCTATSLVLWTYVSGGGQDKQGS